MRGRDCLPLPQLDSSNQFGVQRRIADPCNVSRLSHEAGKRLMNIIVFDTLDTLGVRFYTVC